MPLFEQKNCERFVLEWCCNQKSQNLQVSTAITMFVKIAMSVTLYRGVQQQNKNLKINRTNP